MDGQYLKGLRESKGLSKTEFYAKLGVTRQTGHNWETNRFTVPVGIQAKLEAGAIIGASAAADTRIIDAKTHPQCWLSERSGRRVYIYRTLAHPRWWAGTDSPFQELVASRAEWSAQVNVTTTRSEFEAYTPTTPEAAKELMLNRGCAPDSVQAWLAQRGHAAVLPRLTMAEITGGAITDDTIGT